MTLPHLQSRQTNDATTTVPSEFNSSENESSKSERDKEREQIGYYRDKTNEIDMSVYLDIKDEYIKYVTEERLKECHHTYDTQLNKALNNAIARVAPKNKTFSRSPSLRARVSIVIGIQNYGYNKFWTVLVGEKFGIEMSSAFVAFLEKCQEDLDYNKRYQKELKVKKMRIENYLKKMKEEIEKQKRDKKRGASYIGKGGGLEDIMDKASKKNLNQHHLQTRRSLRRCVMAQSTKRIIPSVDLLIS